MKPLLGLFIIFHFTMNSYNAFCRQYDEQFKVIKVAESVTNQLNSSMKENKDSSGYVYSIESVCRKTKSQMAKSVRPNAFCCRMMVSFLEKTNIDEIHDNIWFVFITYRRIDKTATRVFGGNIYLFVNGNDFKVISIHSGE